MPYFIFNVLGKDVFANVLSENLTQLVSDLRSEYRELVLPEEEAWISVQSHTHSYFKQS